MADAEGNVDGTQSAAQSGADDVNALRAELEQIKKAQAGSDRAYQEAAKKAAALEAEKEALIKEKMSEKEKAEYEFKRQREELEAQKREVSEATLRLLTMKVIAEKGIPAELADYVRGSNEEEIKNSADTLLKRFSDAVGKGVNDKLVGTTPPAAGSTAAATPALPEDWRQLEKKYQGKA
jgi:flagellar biosynthesis GTPase FlhF